MVERAAHLVDAVFPDVPVRQWVLSLPLRLYEASALALAALSKRDWVEHVGPGTRLDIEIIEDEGLVENAADVGRVALSRLEEMKARTPAIGDVRGRGVVLGIELVRDRAAMEPAHDLAEATLYAALDRGLSFKVTRGNVLTLTPPLTVSRADMLSALDIVEAAIQHAQAAL